MPAVTLGLTALVGFAVRERLQPVRDRLVAVVWRPAGPVDDAGPPGDRPPPPPEAPDAPSRPVAPPDRPRMVDAQPADVPGTEPRPVPEPAVPSPPPQGTGNTEPGPLAPPQPAPHRPDTRNAGQLNDLLAAARTALAAEKFDQAEAWLAQASDAAGGGPAAERVAGWEQLTAHARRFTDFRVQALKAGAGRDFDVGADQISVIEVTNEQFVFRHLGRNRRMPLAEVPEAIAMTMTKKWFAGRGLAANHLFIGARYLSRAEPDPAAARKAWTAARQGGEDVSLLLPLLDDPLLIAPPGRR